MGHSAERTSPKGVPFIGRCFACGKTGLTSKQVMEEDCPNTYGIPEDKALIMAIEGEFMSEPKPTCKEMQDHLRERFNLGDEPIFIVRGNDMLAADTIRYWAQIYRENLTLPHSHVVDRARKHEEALAIAADCDEWKTKKLPD